MAILGIGARNPWNLTVLTWIDQAVIGAVMVWILLVAWLLLAQRLLFIRTVALVGLFLVELAGILVLAICAPLAPYGSRELPMPNSDVRVVIDELPGILGKRLDVLTLKARRGLASRERPVSGLAILPDQTFAMIEVISPAAIVIHECYDDEVIVFDPSSLEIVSRTRTAMGTYPVRHPSRQAT